MRIHFETSKLEGNYHGPDGAVIKGPKLKYNTIDVHASSTGHRFWFYFPSGRAWHIDIYFDRRPKSK